MRNVKLQPKKPKKTNGYTEKTKKVLENAGIKYNSPIEDAINAASKKAKSYDQSKPHPKFDFGSKGTYVTTKSGKVGRLTPSGYTSVDTSGYSKGKSEFDLKESKANYKPTVEKIKREEVKPMINSFKKGATRNYKQ